MSRIDEKTTVPLSAVLVVGSVIIGGVFGGAVWATRVDDRLGKVMSDIHMIKRHMGIEDEPITDRSSDHGYAFHGRVSTTHKE